MSRAFRLGIFIVSTLIVLGVGVFLIGSKQYLFMPTYRLTADFDNASGLNNGAEVRVGGIHAGTVQQVQLPQQTGGKVTVVMRLKRGTRNILRKDSTATIKTEGLLGDKYVEITFGTEKAANVENGDSIRGETPPDVAAKATQAIGQIGNAVGTFQEDAEALKHNFLLRGFFKKRGYYDEKELTESRIARLPAAHPAKEFTYDTAQMFEQKAGAKLHDHRALNEAGKFLKENEFNVAVVSVHAAPGESKEQRVENEARAKVVRDYLTKNFKIDQNKVKTFGPTAAKGEAGETGKIQIFVYGGGEAVPQRQARASRSD